MMMICVVSKSRSSPVPPWCVLGMKLTSSKRCRPHTSEVHTRDRLPDPPSTGPSLSSSFAPRPLVLIVG
jgi:hypothetical protein